MTITFTWCTSLLGSRTGSLNDALARAAADVALLFQRWDEKNALEDANSALVQVRRLPCCQPLAVAAAGSQGSTGSGAVGVWQHSWLQGSARMSFWAAKLLHVMCWHPAGAA